MIKVTIAYLLLSISALLAGPSITVPLAFERNAGQTDPQVKFLTRGQGGTVWLTDQGPVLGVIEKSGGKSPGTSRMAVMRMRFEGGKRSPKIEGVNQTGGVTNYFIGNDPAKWRTDVPQFEQVRYRDVYPGIDVVFYGNDRNLEYDFVLQPGADPFRIRLTFDGPGLLAKDSNGDLILKIGDVEIRNHKPVMRQGAQTVAGEYQLSGKRTARFAVGRYDRSRTLVIDPVMTYATLIGGSAGDQGERVAMDPQGNVYIVGTTTSMNFPLKNALFGSLGANQGIFIHVFVTKINPSASGPASVIFSTLFGGSASDDQGFAVGVDGSGNVVIAGSTASPDLPLKNAFTSVLPTDTCFDSTTGAQLPCLEGFVAKFSATGNALIYSTYLGTSRSYFPRAIAVDASGNAWLAGGTTDPFLPIRGNPFQASGSAASAGNEAGFVTEFSPAGSLIYSTYFAGEGGSEVRAIAVDASGNLVIGGSTDSRRLPTSPGAFLTANPAMSGFKTGFVAKLNPNVAGTAALLYGTYLGGGTLDIVHAVAVDSSGNLYAGGSADSPDFPVTANAARATATDLFLLFSLEGFVTKLNPAATGAAQLVYSTFIGGSGDDLVNGLAVDSVGRVVITGITNSPDFFTTPDAFQCCFFGVIQSNFVTQLGFLARLDPAKSGSASVLYSTFLGGTVFTLLNSLAIDSTGNNVVVGGWVDSPDTPVTPSAFQSKYGGDGTLPPNASQTIAPLLQGDAYIATFNFATSGPLITLYENGGGLAAMPGAKIAPGLVFTVKGTFPGIATSSTAQLDPKTGGLATTIGGVQVLVNGIACPLVYVSSTQINAIAPYELANNSTRAATVQVAINNVLGNLWAVSVAPTAPGILSFDDGTGQGAILNQDQTINGSSNPAARGTIVTIFATGEGQTNPPGIDGGLATNLSNLPHPVASLSVTIGGLPATSIAYAGTAPNEVYGLLQVNVTVPNGVTPGSAVPVVLTVGGVSSQSGLTMAVK